MILERLFDWPAGKPLPTGRDLPSDDGEPLETFWHRPAMNLLIESIEYHWRDRKDFCVGGNMFMYFSPERVFNKDFRGPDFFVVKGVEHDKDRLSWVSWEEGDHMPDVIIELSSPTTDHIDRGKKWHLYGEKLRVKEYFIFDPVTFSLEGWRLANGGYDQPITPERHGRLWCEELELFLGTWTGEFQGHVHTWARFFNSRGRLVPTFGEANESRAIREKAKAEREKARADDEQARADAAEAEVAKLKAELEALRKQRPPE